MINVIVGESLENDNDYDTYKMGNGEILELIICGWRPIYESDMVGHGQKIPIFYYF